MKKYKEALERLSTNLVDIRLASKNEGKTFDAVKEDEDEKESPMETNTNEDDTKG